MVFLLKERDIVMGKASKWIAIIMTIIAIVSVAIVVFVVKIAEKEMESMIEQEERLEADARGIGLDGPLNEGFWDRDKVYPIKEGVDLIVRDIRTEEILYLEYEPVAVVSLAIRNETGDWITISKDKLYLEDQLGNKYGVPRGTGRSSDLSYKVISYSISDEDLIFNLSTDFDGNYEGWVLVYEGGEEEIKINLDSVLEDEFAEDNNDTNVSHTDTEDDERDPLQIAEQYGDPIYGQGNGGEHRLENDITLSLHSIRLGRVEGTAGVRVAILNETNNRYYFEEEYMYLEDPEGERYRAPLIDDNQVTISVDPSSINSFEAAFEIPKEYYGDFEGWLFVYEGAEEKLRASVRPL